MKNAFFCCLSLANPKIVHTGINLSPFFCCCCFVPAAVVQNIKLQCQIHSSTSAKIERIQKLAYSVLLYYNTVLIHHFLAVGQNKTLAVRYPLWWVILLVVQVEPCRVDYIELNHFKIVEVQLFCMTDSPP